VGGTPSLKANAGPGDKPRSGTLLEYAADRAGPLCRPSQLFVESNHQDRIYLDKVEALEKQLGIYDLAQFTPQV
jgi:hypothetical protein